MVLNIPGFWIYQGSEYAWVLNMPRFWIYHGSQYTGVTQASECAWISLDNSWICLIMSEYARIFNTNSTLLRLVSLRFQFSIREYAWDREYTRILDMALVLVLHMPGFCIYQGFEYTRVLNMLGFWIYQGFEYARLLNIYQASEYAKVHTIQTSMRGRHFDGSGISLT